MAEEVLLYQLFNVNNITSIAMNIAMSFNMVDFVTIVLFKRFLPKPSSATPFEVNNFHTRYNLTFNAEKVKVEKIWNVQDLRLQLVSVFGPIQMRFERERRIVPTRKSLQNNGCDNLIT